MPPDPKDIDEKQIDWDNIEWETEYDVCKHLRKLGHTVLPVGVRGELRTLRQAIHDFKPHIVFNLLEEFDGEAIYDQNVVSYLELLRIPYTGCNPRGLILARDKALAKKILSYHRIKTPKFWVFRKNRPTKAVKKLSFPLIVKCLNEEASLGIAQASIVYNREKLIERVQYINRSLGVDAIAEEFIEGREMYVGIYGNHRLKTLPVWELFFKNAEEPGKEFYSSRAKFNEEYRKKKGIDTGKAKLSEEEEKHIQKVCKKTFKALDLNGYARIDLRLSNEGQVYILEANPNPDISEYDEFSSSATYAKIKYPDMLNHLLSLGLSWQRIR